MCRISSARLSILAGTVSLDSGNSYAQLLQVRTVIIHNSYNSGTKLNDIALVEVILYIKC
jgi:secreted trypsin-like serine protease